MRLLYLHVEHISWRAKQPALDIRDEGPLDGSAKNALAVFVTVEEDDSTEPSFLRRVAGDIVETAKRVGAERIVLYPYAHLSPNLARPSVAREVFHELARYVREGGVEVLEAPFGWYKEFELRCFGHPLAELSRSFKPGEETKRVEKPQPQGDRYIILTPGGEEYDAATYQFRPGEEDLRALVEKEVLRRELPGGEPRYIEYCRRFGFEWEPMSDPGHMRYGPEATVMMELVEDYAYMVAKSLGIPVFKIRGTNMFRLGEKAVETHARLFGERMYVVEGDSELVMRYAACFQQFAMARDWVISYRDLPFGLLEIADSYRFEQPGETVLCFRLRRFYMPDLHIFARDLREAMEIGLRLHGKIFEEIRKLGRDYVSLYNVTEQFYREHRDYLVELARREGKPILVRVIPEQRSYWVLNVEFHIVDELGRPREIATFQFDVGNAERFGIYYVDERNEKRYPVIIHTAILGSVERYIFAVFDTAAIAEKRGEVPRIPTWLAPIQVRVIPVSRDFLGYAESVADVLESRMIRVDVDDRDETLPRRIRDAERSWIPYIVVIGEREVKEGVLSVRIRGRGVTKMSIDELVKTIESELVGYPRRPLTMPRRLSQRPVYKPVS